VSFSLLLGRCPDRSFAVIPTTWLGIFGVFLSPDRPIVLVVASRCNAPITNLDVPTRNLQNIKERHSAQPAAKRVSPHRILVLPVLNPHSWKELISKNVCFVQLYEAHCTVRTLNLWSSQRRFSLFCLYLYTYIGFTLS